MAAEFVDGFPVLAVAFTDENGDYSFLLDDGAWDIEPPEDGIDTRGAVFLEDIVTVDVLSGPAAVPTLSLPAANAYFEGTLKDDANVAVPGNWVFAERGGDCFPECYNSFTLTRDDGTFSVGVVAPASPNHHDFSPRCQPISLPL